jgi:hypothetical protein
MSERETNRENTPRVSKQKRVLHPGSSTEDAKAVGGKGDFGVPESDVVERTYTSLNTKRADPGAAPPRSGSTGSRESGVGGSASGPGSSSGGDLDTDIVGVAGGGGVATSGKIHEPPGPDDATGTSRDFASGPPAKGSYATEASRPSPGSFVQLPDDRTAGPQGADAVSHPQTDDDSFVGEVSSDEASGRNDAGN